MYENITNIQVSVSKGEVQVCDHQLSGRSVPSNKIFDSELLIW